MASSGKVLSNFTQRVEYLKCSSAAANRSSSEREALASAVAEQLAKGLETEKIEANQAQELFKLISESPFSESQRRFPGILGTCFEFKVWPCLFETLR